ncbi:MAG: hypothetical protein ACLFPE_11570 [Bacteroidales bacterium]
MNKWQIGETAYQYILIILILAAVAYRGGRGFSGLICVLSRK